ncbi:hypothetical protein ACO0RG_003689 [Hanseniaspora osmophila]|uniref:Type 1 phosphatases regulator n=1 Tax=Hanseniaspora osmophila TaxID=56408 RepID=A0A1E5RDG1_9ASCO|nr:Type 1 phosphatases regulator YPI1 [Hanseniaspora osmophila]
MSDPSERTNQSNNDSTTITLNGAPPVIKLRASADSKSNQKTADKKPQVTWKEDVVDNEHMNKKKSKICCIFHPQQEFSDEEEQDGEQSHSESCSHHDHKHDDDNESSSSSDEDGDSDGLDFHARRQRRIERRIRKLKENASKPYEPANAYEIQPDYSHLRGPK